MKAYFRTIFQGSRPGPGGVGVEEETKGEGGDEEGDVGGEDEEGGVRESEDENGGMPQGTELFKKASAWYYVSHADKTNPYMRHAREQWEASGGDNSGSARQQPELMYLSFPWVCAYQQLCDINRMKAIEQ